MKPEDYLQVEARPPRDIPPGQYGDFVKVMLLIVEDAGDTRTIRQLDGTVLATEKYKRKPQSN